MAETVEFASNGHTASGYLVLPPSGTAPGVIVVQEWWGLDPGIKEMAERVAADGFVALAPDSTTASSPATMRWTQAAELMQSLPPDRAARDMSGAVGLSRRYDGVTAPARGVGFCMGGVMTFILAALRPDKSRAAFRSTLSPG